MADEAPKPEVPPTPPAETASAPQPVVPLAVRAQLLATEHWSLLASRSTTQAEVLTRISIFLTLTSAGLVSLALAGQAMKFSGMFPAIALIVLTLVLIVGILTQVRVNNVGIEDLSYVLAMNRLRAAYTDIDPGISPYLMASRFDDLAGSRQTYFMLHRRSPGGHVAGSSMVLIGAVTSALAGLFVAGCCAALGVHASAALVIGVVAGVLYLVVSLFVGGRRYYQVWKHYTPVSPGPSK